MSSHITQTKNSPFPPNFEIFMKLIDLLFYFRHFLALNVIQYQFIKFRNTVKVIRI